MHRLNALAASPRRTLTTLTMLLLAVAVAVGSGASFTSESANLGNEVKAGNINHGNSRDGQALFTVDKLMPGQSASQTVTLTNTADAAAFTMAVRNITDQPGPQNGKLSDVLTLTVKSDAGATALYDGALKSATAVNAGTIPAGQARTYTLTVKFPDSGVPTGPQSGDNRYKQSAARFDIGWTAAG